MPQRKKTVKKNNKKKDDENIISVKEETSISPEKDFFIVGIGASAGGLEALEQFFTKMPSDSGMAFVVVQHLSPDYKSLMVELLSKYTYMKVFRVEDGITVKPDCVYLIPPKKNMSIFHRRLYLTDKEYFHTLNLPIDIFFRSLAEDLQEKAIGIILSGTGTDGTLGIRAIKEKGGMAMVQDEETAKFDGMPRSAISTGLSDYILSPDKMPDELLKYIKHPCISTVNKSDTPILKEEDHLPKVLSIIRNHTGVDFTYYKQNTVVRRIERRLSINQIDKMENYIRYLKQSPYEIDILYRELLIGVTNFFRDPEAFDILKQKVFPRLFESRILSEPVRIWISACSTGEEAYSFAIILLEYLEEIDININIKIFATDIDKNAIEYASSGIYPESIAADVSMERLKRFFIKEGDRYRVNEQLRKLLIFAPHNVTKDPPFHRINLISCRNLLIYFQPVLQKKVLSFFHFALNRDGFLFLGSSETVGEMINLFSIFDTKWKIYQSKSDGKQTIIEEISMPVHAMSDNMAKKHRQAKEHPQDEMIQNIQKEMLKEYVPPSIIIDENYELLHVFGEINKYLAIPSGKVSLNILKMVKEQISLVLRTVIHKVIKENKKYLYKNVNLKEPDNKILNLIVEPFLEPKTKQRMFLIIFEETQVLSSSENIQEVNMSAEVDRHIVDLEQELQYTKENLQATIEELETSNEELQATNEELLAANEELQSTNEELQSVNEELITVNSEYQNKIDELTELNNDMINLLSSTNIGTIFLDKSLCIRKFTPGITNEINLIELDIGRPVTHISHNIIYDDFAGDIEDVLKTLVPREREVQNKKGRWYIIKILPYRTGENIVKGIVITLIDINEIKKANERINLLASAVEEGPSIVVITDTNGVVEYVNHSFTEQTGYLIEDVIGKKISMLKSGNKSPEDYKNLRETIMAGKKWSGEFRNRRKSGELYWEEATIIPVKDKDGKILRFIKVAEDITGKKNRIKAIENTKELYQNTIDVILAHIAILDGEGNIIYVNKSWRDFADMNGLKHENYCIGSNYLNICSSVCGPDMEYAEKTEKMLRQILAGEISEFSIEYPCDSPDEKRWFFMKASAFKINDITHIVVSHENITRGKCSEARNDLL